LIFFKTVLMSTNPSCCKRPSALLVRLFGPKMCVSESKYENACQLALLFIYLELTLL